MSVQIQNRRGTALQHKSFVGAVGEVTVVTDDSSLRVHDGLKVGGHRVANWKDFKVIEYDNVSEMVSSSINSGSIVATMGYYVSGGSGSATYLIMTPAQFVGTPNEISNFTLPNGNIAKLISREILIDQFGADPTGATPSDKALAACIRATQDYTGSNETRFREVIVFGTGTYSFVESFNDTENFTFLNFKAASRLSTQLRINIPGGGIFLNINGEQIQFDDIRAVNDSGSDLTFIRSYLTDGRADSDVTFKNSLFQNMTYVHHCVGRGHQDHNCTLAGGTMCLVESPDPFTAGGSAVTGSVKTGMRRYASVGLEVDSCVAIFEGLTTGPAGEYLNELTIDGINGATLSRLVKGGHWSNVSIKTGALVNSFNTAPILANSLNNATIDISSIKGYSKDGTLGFGDISAFIVDLELDTDNGYTINSTLIDNVTIRGSFANLSEASVRSAGKIGNLTIEGLMLPNAYKLSGSSSVFFVIARGGVESGKRISINDVTFDSKNPSISNFSWVSAAINRDDYVLGNYHKGDLPNVAARQGEFNPVLTIGSTDQVINAYGYYTMDNRVVTAHYEFRLPTKSGATGSLSLNTPVNPRTSSTIGSSIGTSSALAANQFAGPSETILLRTATSKIELRKSTTLGGLIDTDISDGFTLTFTITYQAA